MRAGGGNDGHSHRHHRCCNAARRPEGNAARLRCCNAAERRPSCLPPVLQRSAKDGGARRRCCNEAHGRRLYCVPLVMHWSFCGAAGVAMERRRGCKSFVGDVVGAASMLFFVLGVAVLPWPWLPWSSRAARRCCRSSRSAARRCNGGLPAMQRWVVAFWSCVAALPTALPGSNLPTVCKGGISIH